MFFFCSNLSWHAARCTESSGRSGYPSASSRFPDKNRNVLWRNLMMISVRPGGGQPGRPGDEARSWRLPRPHLSERRRPRAIQLQEVSILPEWYCTGTTHDIWTSLSSFVLDCTVTDCLISSNSTFQTLTNARSKFETKEPGQREVCMGLNSLISCEVGLSTYWTENVLKSPTHAHHVTVESHQTNYCHSQSRHLMTRPLRDPRTLPDPF